MSKRPSDAAAGTSSPKAARQDLSGADRLVATATNDAACQTDSGGTPQEHELLQMALLRIKAALLPQKPHGERHGQSEVAFEELEERLDGLLNQMEQTRKLVDDVLRTPVVARCAPRRHKSRTSEDIWKDVFECFDRDTLETVQVTSRLFDGIISSSQVPILRFIDRVTFENSGYILAGQRHTDADTNIAKAYVKRVSGQEFVVEMDSMMEAYARVIPYFRFSKCLRMELVLDEQPDFGHDSSVDPEKLLKLFAATHNSTCVDNLRLEMGDVNADFVRGIIASMKSVGMLDIFYGGNGDSVDASFFLSCSGLGITDISFDMTYTYKNYAEIGRLNEDGIVAFVLAGATDGKHRAIEFEPSRVNANDLLKLLLEEARKLDPCPRFTFGLMDLYNVDLEAFAKFVHGDLLVIDDMRNGMIMEISIKKYEANVVVRPLSE